MARRCDQAGARGPWPRFLVLGSIALLLVAASVAVAQVPTIRVSATVETAPVPNIGDAADDPAIWIHPTDPSLSTIIGTDKVASGGLGVYDLAGRQLHYYADGPLNNVDVRYNFPLGGSRVALVGATHRDMSRIDFYKVDPAARSLTKVGSVATSPAIKTPRGFSFYVSPVSGKYYAFVSDVGNTDQYVLDGATGSMRGTLVRQFTRPNPTEGLVADDELGRIYLAEENIGALWRYGAEPGDGSTGVMVDSTTESGGTIVQDIKGLGLYYGANRRGYVIAASQGGNSFHLYNRGDNAKVGVFEIGAGAVDAVTGTDGIDVTNLGLGSAFPSGLFVTQDHTNEGGGNQNFKVVPWQAIANGFSPPLLVDRTWDPRLIGASGGGGGGPVTPPGNGGGQAPPPHDNCPSVANDDQANADGDAQGDACDLDDDNDGVTDARDACPTQANPTPSGCPRPGAPAPTPGAVAAPVASEPAPPADTSSGAAATAGPRATLSAKRSQELGMSVAVVVGCEHEACVASASGTLSATGTRPVDATKLTRSMTRGSRATLRLKLSRKARTTAARALRKHRKVTARITVIVRDSAGNRTVLKTTIRLTRRHRVLAP